MGLNCSGIIPPLGFILPVPGWMKLHIVIGRCCGLFVLLLLCATGMNPPFSIGLPSWPTRESKGLPRLRFSISSVDTVRFQPLNCGVSCLFSVSATLACPGRDCGRGLVLQFAHVCPVLPQPKHGLSSLGTGGFGQLDAVCPFAPQFTHVMSCTPRGGV